MTRTTALALLLVTGFLVSPLFLPIAQADHPWWDHPWDYWFTCRVADAAGPGVPLERIYLPMEGTHLGELCAGHVGYAQFSLADQGVFTLLGGEGDFIVKETTWTPETEDLVRNVQDFANDPSECVSALLTDAVTLEDVFVSCNPADWKVTIETSLDGLSWHEVASFPYVPSGGESTQQIVVPSSDEPFRFLRARTGETATQGLHFLDAFYLGIDVETIAETGDVAWPQQGATHFGCGDGPVADPLNPAQSFVMEDVFETHPCWFGGLGAAITDPGWYDAASNFHTYPIGERTIASVAGTFTVGMYRIPDHALCFDGTLEGLVNQIPEDLADDVYVQISENGRDWTTVKTLEDVPYYTETGFSVDFDTPETTGFVRLATQLSPCFAGGGGGQRFDGYFLSSEFAIEDAEPRLLR